MLFFLFYSFLFYLVLGSLALVNLVHILYWHGFILAIDHLSCVPSVFFYSFLFYSCLVFGSPSALIQLDLTKISAKNLC